MIAVLMWIGAAWCLLIGAIICLAAAGMVFMLAARTAVDVAAAVAARVRQRHARRRFSLEAYAEVQRRRGEVALVRELAAELDKPTAIESLRNRRSGRVEP